MLTESNDEQELKSHLYTVQDMRKVNVYQVTLLWANVCSICKENQQIYILIERQHHGLTLMRAAMPQNVGKYASNTSRAQSVLVSSRITQAKNGFVSEMEEVALQVIQMCIASYKKLQRVMDIRY